MWHFIPRIVTVPYLHGICYNIVIPEYNGVMWIMGTISYSKTHRRWHIEQFHTYIIDIWCLKTTWKPEKCYSILLNNAHVKWFHNLSISLQFVYVYLKSSMWHTIISHLKIFLTTSHINLNLLLFIYIWIIINIIKYQIQ